MKFLITVPTLLLTAVCLFAQVSNVRVQQRTDGSLMVDIYYDFSNPVVFDMEIMGMQASNDNGATWDLDCVSLTGDIGAEVTFGTDRHIVWDFYADNPGMSGDQFKVRLLYYLFDFMIGNDGTVYKTVKIGDQWWMAENLRETKYNNGVEIPVITDDYEWEHCYSFNRAARCVYNHDESNADTYGYIYNGHAANNSKIAPVGWHLATDDDWKELEMFMGMTQAQADEFGTRGTDQGAKLKSITSWDSGNGNNITRFSAIPGGYRWTRGNFSSLGEMTVFISSYITEYVNNSLCFTRRIKEGADGIERMSEFSVMGGYIRLVKD